MQMFQVRDSFTRPANTTAYTAADLIANSTVVGSVAPLDFAIPNGRGVKIWRAEISHSSTAITASNFRLHLYKDSPTVANADNGAWQSTYSNYLGFIDADSSDDTFTDGGGNWGNYDSGDSSNPMVAYLDSDRRIYGLIEALEGYTPASAETFTVSLIGESYA